MCSLEDKGWILLFGLKLFLFVFFKLFVSMLEVIVWVSLRFFFNVLCMLVLVRFVLEKFVVVRMVCCIIVFFNLVCNSCELFRLVLEKFVFLVFMLVRWVWEKFILFRCVLLSFVFCIDVVGMLLFLWVGKCVSLWKLVFWYCDVDRLVLFML